MTYPPFVVAIGPNTFVGEDPRPRKPNMKRVNYVIVCGKCGDVWARIIQQHGSFHLAWNIDCEVCGGGSLMNQVRDLFDVRQSMPKELLIREFLALHEIFIKPHLERKAA